MTTFPISARSLKTGTNSFGPVNIPVGTHQAVLTLDVSSMVPGQVVDLLVEHFDGTNWLGFRADFDGPWRDKHGVLHNDVSLSFDFGSVAVNGEWVPRASAAGWKVRATFTVTNGPYNTAGGTLVLT